jgi:pyruvate kinase
VTCRRNGELIRGRAAMLAPITAKDWCDIDWALSLGVDFLAISFVRTADALHNLRYAFFLGGGGCVVVWLIFKGRAFCFGCHLPLP